MATRAVVADRTAPAIDRGWRAGAAHEAEAWRDRALADLVGDAAGASALSTDLPGALIVKFAPGVDDEAIAHVVRAAGAHSIERPTFADFHLLHVDADIDVRALAARVAALPGVVYAEPRGRVVPQWVPNDPLYSRQWNLHELGMERVWNLNRGATQAVTVAVLDTGVAFRDAMMRYDIRARPLTIAPGVTIQVPHTGVIDVPFAAAPDLAGPGKFVAPWDFVWNDPNPLDLFGHGTHVAGSIGQLTNNATGVAAMAFNVRIMPVKVVPGLWDFVLGAPQFGTDTIARGIRYAADHGAQVINMSIGASGQGVDAAIEDALRYAVSRGTFTAIAIGNSGQTTNEINPTAALAARIDGVVAVGAVGPGLVRAPYSVSSPIVDISAPGGGLPTLSGTPFGVVQQTLDPDLSPLVIGPTSVRAPRFDAFIYRESVGTSMATPHVSAMAALLVSQGVSNPAAIEAALKRFAIDKGAPGRDDEYGYGVIDPWNTLRGLGLVK